MDKNNKQNYMYGTDISLKSVTCATTLQQLYGPLSGTTWRAGTRRKIHPLTPILIINHPLSASAIYDP